MVKLAFTKMVGNGNDFIVLDNRNGVLTGDFQSIFARICQRRTSIGADGILLLEKDPEFSFSMRYFNCDGSEANMCGNGARCIALLAREMGIAPAKMVFSSKAGVHAASVSGSRVRLKFTDPTDTRLDVPLTIDGESLVLGLVNSGVPHAVLFVQNVDGEDVLGVGRRVRYHAEFQPDGTNVNFVQIVGKSSISIRTYERGVEGETLSCGTGAVASAIVSHLKGKVIPPVEVGTLGGPLRVDFLSRAEGVKDIYLEGEARIAYNGTIEL